MSRTAPQSEALNLNLDNVNGKSNFAKKPPCPRLLAYRYRLDGNRSSHFYFYKNAIANQPITNNQPLSQIRSGYKPQLQKNNQKSSRRCMKLNLDKTSGPLEPIISRRHRLRIRPRSPLRPIYDLWSMISSLTMQPAETETSTCNALYTASRCFIFHRLARQESPVLSYIPGLLLFGSISLPPHCSEVLHARLHKKIQLNTAHEEALDALLLATTW